MTPPVPPHPYWCDDCGQHAPFRMPFCPIPHVEGCTREGEDAMDIYYQALAYVQATGQEIP